MIPSARALGVALLALAGMLVAVVPPEAEAGPATAVKAAASPPNIVVVLTDDMRADELRFLPAVRRLQRSGVTFSRALSADSLCCPARATLLTGKLAHNHKTVGNDLATHGGYQVFAANNDVQDLLPQWLRDGGYRTGWIGKYLNGFRSSRHFDQPDWTYFAPAVREVYNYWSGGFAVNGRYRQAIGYREVFTRGLLLDLVREWAPSKRPFFVLDSTLAPHRGAGPGSESGLPAPQPEHQDFDAARLVPRPSVGERDVSDKPAWLRSYVEGLGGRQEYPLELEVRRVEALQSVNDTVHALVRTLRRQHELKRTLVIFTSDNGFMLNEHNLGNKNKAYEESVHVPLVLRGPGFRGGGTEGSTVSLADVTATILRTARASLSHGQDGVPLQRVLGDPASFARRPIEIEGSTAMYPQPATLPTDAIGRFYSGAVWGPYSLVHYGTGDREFYDRSVDPWQMSNSYTEDPAAGSPQALLQRWYAEHVDCRGSDCNDLLPTP